MPLRPHGGRTMYKALALNSRLILVVLAVALVLVFAVGYRVAHAGDKAPAVGTAAPDFTLNSQENKPVSLHDFKGKWVVLYFYPKDFTSGCTVEAHNFQREIARYQGAGITILGVSVDSAQSHKDFCAKEGLNFKLLADPGGKVSAKYGSTMDYHGTLMAAR